MLHPPSRPTTAVRRLAVVALAAGLAAATGGCTSKVERANQFDQLADQMVANGALPAAAGTLQRAVALDSNNADRWVRLGRVQRQLDMVAPAATSYQRALDLAPDNVEALQAISVLLVRGGQYDLAKSYAATLAVLAPDDIGGLLAQGAIALHEDRRMDADRFAERIMTLAPSLSDGFVLKARVLEKRGQVRDATNLLARRLAFDSQNVGLAEQVLRLTRKIGDREGIRSVSLLLAKLKPDDPRYQLEAARTLRARGRAAEADRTLAAVEKRWRGNSQVMLGLAHQWLDTQPRDDAAGRIAGLAATAPPGTRALLANLLVDLDQPARALALLRPVLGDRIDGDNVDVQAAYAGALLALGRTAEAGGRAEQVLAYDNRNIQGLVVRAQAEAARKDFRHALDDAQLAMAEEPTNRDAPLLIARFWATQGNAVMADKAFGTAQDRFPDDFAIHRARIAWLVTQGRAADAAALASGFANQHGDSHDALMLMAATCATARDTLCAADAKRRLARG